MLPTLCSYCTLWLSPSAAVFVALLVYFQTYGSLPRLEEATMNHTLVITKLYATVFLQLWIFPPRYLFWHPTPFSRWWIQQRTDLFSNKVGFWHGTTTRGDDISAVCFRGLPYMTSARFSDFSTPFPPPCHCHKSADFVPFICFLGTTLPPPTADVIYTEVPLHAVTKTDNWQSSSSNVFLLYLSMRCASNKEEWMVYREDRSKLVEADR